MGVFVNHTNHPFENWSDEQMEAARQYGEVIDVNFPAVEAGWDEAAVDSLARENARCILAMQPSAVLVQGEFTYSYALIGYLLKAGADVLAACSERCTECFVNEQQETIRRSVYKFVRFRSYKTV